MLLGPVTTSSWSPGLRASLIAAFPPSPFPGSSLNPHRGRWRSECWDKGEGRVREWLPPAPASRYCRERRDHGGPALQGDQAGDRTLLRGAQASSWSIGASWFDVSGWGATLMLVECSLLACATRSCSGELTGWCRFGTSPASSRLVTCQVTVPPFLLPVSWKWLCHESSGKKRLSEVKMGL